MKTDLARRGWIMFLLLVAGLVLAWLRPAPALMAVQSLADALWRSRRADLIIQLGLMLVGALGIRSLLPGDDEPDEPVSQEGSHDLD